MHRKLITIFLLLATTHGALGAPEYDIKGVDGLLLDNVRRHISAFSIAHQSDVSEADFDSLLQEAISKAEAALRPYGYYNPKIDGLVLAPKGAQATIRLNINRGVPVVIERADIEVVGEGKAYSEVKSWLSAWPLKVGSVLDQSVWEQRKQSILDQLDASGYLAAEFKKHEIEIDRIGNSARIGLILDTGPRFVFGEIDYGEHVLKPGILEFIPRFRTGAAYNSLLLDKFRLDLWKTGYFTEVIVTEVKRPEASPPVVDLKVRLETETRNTYQGSLGVGTDTGIRVQGQWNRQPVSSNGDRLDVGAGWQQQDNEFSVRGSYRLPRLRHAREYWVSDLVIRFERVNLDVRRSENSDFIRIADGTVDERHLRLGRLKVRNVKSGEQQAFETWFIQGLSASDQLQPLDTVPELADLADDATTQRLLKGTDKTLSVGVDYDLIAISGKGWQTKGRRDRAWAFGSSKSFGSDRNFLQAYIGTRRSYLKGERWKFIVRAEAGYTKAKVADYTLEINAVELPLSVTNLPNYYRFKAGGGNSVRGYGFEELNNNNIGSNHIITASAEVEMKVLQNWSAAAFIDIGNAFNDWSKPELRLGAGVGFRWYSIAGPIRVDVARGLDLEGKPWRVHFTIGTPLL